MHVMLDVAHIDIGISLYRCLGRLWLPLVNLRDIARFTRSAVLSVVQPRQRFLRAPVSAWAVKCGCHGGAKVLSLCAAHHSRRLRPHYSYGVRSLPACAPANLGALVVLLPNRHPAGDRSPDPVYLDVNLLV